MQECNHEGCVLEVGITEKLKPTYALEEIKRAFSSVRHLRMTRTARNCAFALGFSRQDIVDCIHGIEVGHFYKSMTSDRDHRVWQDVYHVPWAGLTLYVKFVRSVNGCSF